MKLLIHPNVPKKTKIPRWRYRTNSIGTGVLLYGSLGLNWKKLQPSVKRKKSISNSIFQVM